METPVGSHIGESHDVEIETPSVRYAVNVPSRLLEMKPSVEYEAAIILRFPSFYLEFVSPSGRVPSNLRNRVRDSGWELGVRPA